MQNVEDVYPLSSLQELMLSYALAAPESEVLSEQSCYRIDGDLDADAFQRAWQAIVDRHAILRTAFVGEGLPKPLQVVRQQIQLPWTVEDWSDGSAHDQQRRLGEWLDTDRKHRFDSAEAPLMRLQLIRLGDQQHFFTITVHHILLDRWSRDLLWQEVFAYYAAYRQGRELDLDPPRPLRDYIAWVQQQDASLAEAYWRDQLHEFVPTSIFTPRAFDSAKADEARSQTVLLDAATTQILRSQARQHRLTVNTLVQGAWALLLAHHGGTSDVAFGATVSGRPAELERVDSIAGLLMNNMPMRVRLPEEDRSSIAWLQELQAQQFQMQPYEYTPLAQLLEWLELPGGMPLFESLLVFQNRSPLESRSSTDGLGLALSLERGRIRTNYPVTLVTWPGEELRLDAIYDLTESDAQTLAAMMSQIEPLLVSLAAHADSLHAWFGSLGSPRAPRKERVTAPSHPSNRTAAGRDDGPRTALEECVFRIWRDLLGTDEIGVHDRFFELGGTSLLAVRLTMRLKEELHVELGLHALFETPTIAELAHRLEALKAEQDKSASATTAIVDMVEHLSDEEVRRLLAEDTTD